MGACSLKSLESPALHFLNGCLEKFLKENPVPVGDHNLSGLEVTAQFPDLARVTRAEGTAGEGFNSGKPVKASVDVTLRAVLLYLKQCEPAIEHDHDLWLKCIREDLKSTEGADKLLPPEALEALAIVQEEQPVGRSEPKRTPASRTGDLEVQVTIKRPKRQVAKA